MAAHGRSLTAIRLVATTLDIAPIVMSEEAPLEAWDVVRTVIKSLV